MNISRDVINDLLPLYLTNDCSPDTRALIEEYLRDHPDLAKEIKAIQKDPIPRTATPALDETTPLRKARRILRWRSGLLALAIFFSLAPFSFLHTDDRTYFLFTEDPRAAIVYGVFAILLWLVYVVVRRRTKTI